MEGGWEVPGKLWMESLSRVKEFFSEEGTENLWIGVQGHILRAR